MVGKGRFNFGGSMGTGQRNDTMGGRTGQGAGGGLGSSTIVAGGGSASSNGTYTPRGTANGKTYYNLVGQPDSTVASVIVWTGVQWFMIDALLNANYRSLTDVAFPWLATWLLNDGVNPVPTVTQGP